MLRRINAPEFFTAEYIKCRRIDRAQLLKNNLLNIREGYCRAVIQRDDAISVFTEREATLVRRQNRSFAQFYRPIGTILT